MVFGNGTDINSFFTALSDKVLFKQTGDLKHGNTVKFLGRQFAHRGDNVLITAAEGYVDELLDLYNMKSSSPVTTTGSATLKRPNDGEEILD